MRNKCAFIVILMSCFFIAGPAMSVQAREPVVISTLSGPFGSGPYVINTAAEDLSKRHHPWLRIDHSESPGYVFSLKKLAKEPKLRKSMIIGSGAVLNWMAGEGLKPFEKQYPTVRLLANYYILSVWLATLDPDLKSGKDLIGKKIGLGRPVRVNMAVEPEWVVRHGWGIREQVTIEYLGAKQIITALLDGLVDASAILGYFNPLNNELTFSPNAMELLASGRKVYIMPWGEEAVNKTRATTGMPINPITLPANTIEGQKEPLDGFSDTSGWFAAPEFPEDLAYEFTKFVIEHVSEFAEYGAVGKLMSRKGLPFGWTPETIHPGALKAYKEAGIIK